LPQTPRGVAEVQSTWDLAEIPSAWGLPQIPRGFAESGAQAEGEGAWRSSYMEKSASKSDRSDSHT